MRERGKVNAVFSHNAAREHAVVGSGVAAVANSTVSNTKAVFMATKMRNITLVTFQPIQTMAFQPIQTTAFQHIQTTTFQPIQPASIQHCFSLTEMAACADRSPVPPSRTCAATPGTRCRRTARWQTPPGTPRRRRSTAVGASGRARWRSLWWSTPRAPRACRPAGRQR